MQNNSLNTIRMETKDNNQPTIEPFVIVKSLITSLGMQSFGYEKVPYPYKSTFYISKKRAQKYIDKYDMEVVYKEDGCKIWEMKGRPFFNKYKGYFAMNEKINYICNTKENEEESRK